MTDFVVVGGGVGGLVAARSLAAGGASVVLLEASDTLGGTLSHHTVGGLILDSGAESFAVRRGTVAALATELGLGGDIVTPASTPAWLYRDSGAVQLPATSHLGIPSVPLAADVISVVGFSAAFRAYLDTLLPGSIGAKSATLGELVRRRMGARLVEQLVAPVTMGVHSRHPDDLDLDRISPTLRAALRDEGSLARAVRSIRESSAAGSAVAGIIGGVHRIALELEADLERFGVDIRLGQRATVVDGFVPGFEGARVVVAAAGVEGALESAPAAGRPVTLATLVLDAPELDAAPRGTGVLVTAEARGIRAKALTHSTAKWPWLAERAEGKHVVRLSFETEPADLAAAAREDAATLLGIDLPESSVLDFARTHWVRPSPQGEAAPGVTLVGEATSGTGLAAVVGHAQSTAAALLTAP